MVQNAARESFPLRGCHVDSQPGLPHLLKSAANSRIGLASEKAALAVVMTIRRDCFADSVVAIRLQQISHHVFNRRPDGALDVERPIRFMPKSTQRRHAAS